jgi:hypothetical protein
MFISDIISADGFGLSELTAAIYRAPYAPNSIAKAGLFSESGVTTTTATIELYDGALGLVQTSARGTSPGVVSQEKRTRKTFEAPRIATMESILADSLQNRRVFGDTSMDALEIVRDRAIARLRNQIEMTHEHQRVTALQGIVLDADNTPIINLFTEFGLTQQVLAGVATATDVRSQIFTAITLAESVLGNATPTGYKVFCGKTFWASLIANKSIVNTYIYSQDAASVRGDTTQSFVFGGVEFIRYRGGYIADGEAYLCPEGVQDMFVSYFAPADYMETVGTMGLPMYAKAFEMDRNRGILLEAQSNPLHLVTRPDAVIKLTA